MDSSRICFWHRLDTHHVVLFNLFSDQYKIRFRRKNTPKYLPNPYVIECIMESGLFLFALDLACFSFADWFNPYLDAFESSNWVCDVYTQVLVVIPLFHLVNNSSIVECLHCDYELDCKRDLPVISMGAAKRMRFKMVGATSANIPSFNAIPESFVTKITGTGFKLCAVFGVPSAFSA